MVPLAFRMVRPTLTFAVFGAVLCASVAPAAAGGGDVRASMDGAIVSVLVNEGDQVEAGQTLVILEAMKMEHPLKAGMPGVVSHIATQVGEQVKSQQLLASVSEEEH